MEHILKQLDIEIQSIAHRLIPLTDNLAHNQRHILKKELRKFAMLIVSKTLEEKRYCPVHYGIKNELTEMVWCSACLSEKINKALKLK